MKGTTLERAPATRAARRRDAFGMLNSVGLKTRCKLFLEMHFADLQKLDVPVIVNIAGSTAEEYGLLAKNLT